MIRTPHRGLVFVLPAVAAVAGYCVYEWRNAAPSPRLQDRQIIVSTTEASYATANPTAASALSTVSPTTQSPLQLHAAFRESQQCLEEWDIVRANRANHIASMPPHIPGCNDMKGALRRNYEATRAAAQAGDIDAQMCYLMQIAGDRDSGFMLSDAEIAEYHSLAPQYVDAAFKRGDWRVVDLLGFHVVDSAGLFVGLEQWKDPVREYKAHELLLLGVGDVDPQDPDYWLPVLRIPESTLSAQEIRNSDAWAREMYDKYFSSQPRLIKEPSVCTDS
jgi:hypothetical protein